MRSIIIMLALIASSCVTQRVQDRTLLPAIESAWPGVRADAAVGGMPEAQLIEWDARVADQLYRGADTIALEIHALVGVDLRLVNGEIGINGAGIMRDRARAFRRAVDEYNTGVLVASSAPVGRDYAARPIVISRSSWASSPPPAIAARTYR